MKIFILSTFLTFQLFADNRSICGDDNRVLSNIPQVGRAGRTFGGNGCAFTLIGKTCGISAGHCRITLRKVEFNTPISVAGISQESSPSDQYEIDKTSLKSGYNVILGVDYLVGRLKPNSITGKYPGEVQGFYEIDFSKPILQQKLRVSSHGKDSDNPELSYSQQTDIGYIQSISGTRFTHNADTEAKSSGAAIVRESDQKIIGVHTGKGCSSEGGGNSATLIHKNNTFINAIQACLQWEKENLN